MGVAQHPATRSNRRRSRAVLARWVVQWVTDVTIVFSTLSVGSPRR